MYTYVNVMYFLLNAQYSIFLVSFSNNTSKYRRKNQIKSNISAAEILEEADRI